MKFSKPKIILRFIALVIFFGLFLFLLYKVFFFIDARREKQEVVRDNHIARLTAEQIAKLQDADIILRRGYGFFSDVISRHLNDSVFDVTHCGILYNDNGCWFVVHSLSSDVSDIDGVQCQRLEDFLKYSYPNKLLITSVKNITDEERKAVVDRAKYYLSKQVPFDHYGNIDDPSQLYCTELLWQILDNDLHILSLPKDKDERKSFFSSMVGTYNPKYFDIIINTY